MGVVDEIKQRLDIVDIVSANVALQKAGKGFRALCPFHAEKTPSFFVFPESQSWHCFGSCATGGDVFTFVMKKENLPFGEALRLLAERAGVSLSPGVQPQEDAGKERLRQINKESSLHYHRLLRQSPEAQIARDYLAKRGISEESVKTFELGFSSSSWQDVHGALTGLGFGDEDLVKAGVAIQGEGGGIHDRFRGKLMFPIRDQKGHVVGFGARTLDNSLPKYINSPQTDIFDKGSILYAIDVAKAEVRRRGQVVLVEGYMDAIMAHQYGFCSVVASMGTALGEGQVRLLKGIAREIVLALDADAAGEHATRRSLEVISRSLEQKVVPVPTWQGWIRYEQVVDGELKVAVLPQGMDPDEIIKVDCKEWERLIGEAIPILDYVTKAVTAGLDLQQSRDKASAVEQLLPLFADIADPVRRAHYFQRLARLVGVDESTLQSMARKTRGKVEKAGRSLGGTEDAGARALFSPSPLEEFSLAMLFQNQQLREAAQELEPDYLCSSEHRELLSAWRQAPDNESLKRCLGEPLQSKFTALLVKPLPPVSRPDEVRQAFSDCLLRLRENYLKGLKLREEAFMAGLTAEEGSSDLQVFQQKAADVNAQLKAVFVQRGQRSRFGE